jgi:hypothetical protein
VVGILDELGVDDPVPPQAGLRAVLTVIFSPKRVSLGQDARHRSRV